MPSQAMPSSEGAASALACATKGRPSTVARKPGSGSTVGSFAKRRTAWPVARSTTMMPLPAAPDRIGDVRKARPAARRIEAHVVERGALGDQAAGEHDGANHGVGGQVDGDEFRAARDQRGAGAGVAHVEAPERVVGV